MQVLSQFLQERDLNENEVMMWITSLEQELELSVDSDQTLKGCIAIIA